MLSRVLNILRDQAHVKEFLLMHDGEAMSVAEFFGHSQEESLNSVVAEWLAEHDPAHLRWSFDYVQLLNSLKHGLCTPREILERPGEVNFRIETIRRLDRFAPAPKALELPSNLSSFSQIRCHYLVDLSDFELGVLIRISELGIPIEMIWPVDDQGRGMTLPVSYLVDQIERRHDLDNIEISFVPIDILAETHVCRAVDINAEARFVAQTITQLRRESNSIAVGMRILDNRALFFKDALRLQGIKIRERKGVSLLDTVAAYTVIEWLRLHAPENATLKQFQILALDACPEHVQGAVQLKAKLHREISLLTKEQKPISLLSYIKWFEKNCSQEYLPVPVYEDESAIEFLPLPEILGREFDYVVIVDLAHGRCPQNPKPQPLFSDTDRFWLNHFMQRPVLRLYEDNPLEPSPVPARQALEPMWFLGACSAAKKGLILTSSRRDESGRDQASSEFFDDVLDKMGLDPETFEGIHSSLNLEATEREKYFHEAKSRCAPSVSNYQIDKILFRRQFQNRLGLLAERPLTPTRVEGLAVCPFKGYVEKILNVDTNRPVGFDTDVRVIGHLAHEALEIYYRSAAEDRGSISQILASLVKDNDVVFRANMRWLAKALERLVSILAKDPPVSDVKPIEFELPIGVGKGLSSVPLNIASDVIHFGGVIDRVDESAHARVVIDYKTSTAMRTRQKIDEKELLITHFQLPLYLRLLEHHMPTPETTELLAYLIAIRDGVASPILGRERMPDLRRRVMDDSAEDGLARSLERILTPLLNGDVTPKPGDICQTCRLRRVCRVNFLAKRELDR